MSRKKRVWYPGATYHVMSRGNRRTKLYKDRSDHMRFLECIESCGGKYDFKIHSICLMTNHFHMILETGNDELWKIMQRILHPYSMGFNSKYNFTGHAELGACHHEQHSPISLKLPASVGSFFVSVWFDAYDYRADYLSSKSSIVQPRTLDIRYRVSALALLISLFLCSYICIERRETPDHFASSIHWYLSPRIFCELLFIRLTGIFFWLIIRIIGYARDVIAL